MRSLNYSFHLQIPGEGFSGRRLNSVLRVKLGNESEDNYEHTIPTGIDKMGRLYYNLFGDKFTIDYSHCGKNWEKCFSVEEATDVSGCVKVTITNLTKYPVNFDPEGWSTEVDQNK
jgi:hypothetical protein